MGARIVLRNSEGEVVASKALLFDNVSLAFVAKAIACSQAMELGVDLKIDKLIFEGDSLSVIKKCNLNNIDKSENSSSR